MDNTTRSWTVFDAETPILTFEYCFGPGLATALAVGGADGLVVVSPPCEVSDAAFDGLEKFGPVRALVASNAYHHMGIPQWKTRFPDAALFAPAQSIARVEKQSGLRGFRPLAEAADIAGPRLELIDMPHYRTGEVLVRIETAGGLAWYVTDVILNIPVLPPNPVARFLFRVSRSAPGLRYNNIAPLFMVKDKAALKRWLAAEAASRPPRWLIPAHGDIVDFQADPQAARKLFAAS
jgi:hypothetical protein